jgi:hypothetical protein
MEGVALKPPPKYTALDSIERQPVNSTVNVIGVIVDLLPPAPTKGTGKYLLMSMDVVTESS